MNKNSLRIIGVLLAVVCYGLPISRADEKLPIATNFEAVDGYTTGNIVGQKGWIGDEAAGRVVTGPALDSSAVLELSRGESWVTHRLDVGTAPIVNISFLAKPFAGSTPEKGTQFSVDGAGVSFAQNALGAQLFTYETNKSKWVPTSYVIPRDAGGTNLAWLNLNFQLNYKASQWSVSINDETVATGLPLENSMNERGQLVMSAGPEGDAHVEAIRTEALEFEQMLLANPRLPTTWVTCDSCGGYGKRQCDNQTCSGGDMDCSVCDGDGRSRLQCSNCNTGFEWFPCTNCEGPYGEADPDCSCDDGYVKDFCSKCDGYVWVEDDCQSCKDSSGRSTGKEKCTTCGGSGTISCTPCGGSGVIPG